MGRQLVDRKTCEECWQVVDVLADGAEVGHGEHPCLAELSPTSPEPGPPDDAPETRHPLIGDHRSARKRRHVG